jgi:c-di-GMP-binding flagellar brake protein YcgR
MQSNTIIVKDVESVLKVSQNVDVAFDHPDFLEEYKSRIEKIEEEKVCISMPSQTRIPLNTHCLIYYIYKDQRYEFETTVKGYEKKNVNVMVLPCPAEVLRLQRRKSFRISVDVPVTCRIPRKSEDDEERGFSGTIRNISSGGMLMFAEEEIPMGCELLVFLSIVDEIDLSDLPARIVRTGVFEKRKKKSIYEYGVEFYNIHSRLRDAIMHFVLNRQIEMNRLSREKE